MTEERQMADKIASSKATKQLNRGVSQKQGRKKGFERKSASEDTDSQVDEDEDLPMHVDPLAAEDPPAGEALTTIWM